MFYRPIVVLGTHGNWLIRWWKSTKVGVVGHDGSMEENPMTVRPDRAPLRKSLLTDLLSAPDGPIARLEVLAKVGSTNTELARLVAQSPDDWPAPALLIADHQEAGRGRLDRAWQTPEHTALTCSLLLRPQVPQAAWSWLPLLTGLATVRAVRAMTGVQAGLKWPNDLLAPTDDGDMLGWGKFRKVGGILTEVLPDGGVIVGLGLNVFQEADELPVASATSLHLAGGALGERELLLTALQESLSQVFAQWYECDGDAERAGLRADVEDALITVGHEIRAYVPGGREVRGVAQGLNVDGGLVVHTTDGSDEIVLSGDVHHVRLAGGA